MGGSWGLGWADCSYHLAVALAPQCNWSLAHLHHPALHHDNWNILIWCVSCTYFWNLGRPWEWFRNGIWVRHCRTTTLQITGSFQYKSINTTFAWLQNTDLSLNLAILNCHEYNKWQQSTGDNISSDPQSLHFIHYAGELENHTVKTATSEKQIPNETWQKWCQQLYYMVHSVVISYIKYKWSIIVKHNTLTFVIQRSMSFFIFYKVMPDDSSLNPNM